MRRRRHPVPWRERYDWLVLLMLTATALCLLWYASVQVWEW